SSHHQAGRILRFLKRLGCASLFCAVYPTVADLFVRTFHSRPRNLMCPYLLVCFSRVRGKGVVERLAVDALRMSRQMMAHRFRKVGIGSVRHIFLHRSLGKAAHGNRADFMTSIKCSELFALMPFGCGTCSAKYPAELSAYGCFPR